MKWTFISDELFLTRTKVLILANALQKEMYLQRKQIVYAVEQSMRLTHLITLEGPEVALGPGE